jgi:hypothetical protein
MLKSSRFIDERLAVSITSLTPPANPVDFNSPLTFQVWIKYNNSLYTNTDDFLQRYNSYLNNWYEVKNIQRNIQEETTRSLYTTLINEIVLNYTTNDERRFLKNIDFNNNKDLAVAVPFFAQKIKEICLYYSTLRDDVKTGVTRYNLKGSNYGIQKLIYNEISKSLETEDLTDLIKNLNLSLSSIRNNMVIDVEDLFDTYTNYLDTSFTYPASSYNTEQGERKEFFNLNQYNLDENLFLNFNYSIVNAITSYPFFLIELGNNNFSISPIVNSENFNFLKDSDFINTVNTENNNNLNLNLQKELIEKYVGTDFYFLSTGNTVNKFLSGTLFTANNEFANYINKRFPSVAAVPSEEFLKTSKDIGLFFKPDKIGFSNFNSFGQKATINRNVLSANTVYIFPDPQKFQNISGLTEQEFTSPLTFIENNYYNKIDFSNQYRFGDSETNSFFQTFRAYQTREQSLDLSLQGLSRYSDPQDFFKGDIKNIWANDDVFPKIPSNLFPIDSRLEKLYSLNKTLVQSKGDIYGNEFNLYKDVHPLKKARNNKEDQDLDIYLCLLIRGHLFYDSISGSNFDYTTINQEKGYSGIILKTTDNIPPGSGYYTQGPSFISPSPYALDAYNEGAPRFVLTGENVPIVSYRFYPESFCPTFIQLNFLCNVYDGVTFTVKGVPLSDSSSDDPLYNPDIGSLYYNELIDGGMNKDGPNYRANFVYAGNFLFTPTQSAYTVFDGTYFLVNSSEPCGNELEFEISYNEKSTFLDYHIPQRDTQVLKGLSGLNKKRSLYQVKYIDYGDLYYRNSNSSIILPASAALSGIYIKYNQIINNELITKLINFDIYYDTLQFETENYLIFEKIVFDYESNLILNKSRNDCIFIRGENKKIEKISTVWFDEIENILFFCKTILFNELSATNYKIIYPEIYTVNIDTLRYTKIYPLETSSTLTFDYLKQFSLSGNSINVNIVEIDKPLFNYNDDTGQYSITYLGRDIANVFYIFKVLFKYVNGKIINLINTMYKLAPDANTINFSSPLSSSYLTYNILGNNPGYVSNGAFVFGI